jgi:hypothetical protein
MNFTTQIFMKITISERGLLKAFCPKFHTNQTKNAKEKVGTIFQTYPQHSRSPQLINPIKLRSLTKNFVETV